MNALIRMQSAALRWDLAARRGWDPDPPGSPLHEQLQALSQSTARQCTARGVAFQWNLIEGCHPARLSRSAFLHVSGVLQQLVADVVHSVRSRNLRVSFGCDWNRLVLVVEDDGGDPEGPASIRSLRDRNVEYLAAEAAGTIRHASRGRYRASIFWLRLDF